MKLKIKILSFLTLCVFIFWGCPGSKRDETEFLRATIDTLRTEARQFLVELNKNYYENWVLGKELKLSRLYNKHKDLFSTNTIDIFNRSLKIEQRPERVDKIYRFKTYVYNEIVNIKSIAITEKIENLKTEGNLYLFGKSIPFYNAKNLLAKEPKQKNKEKIYEEMSKFLNKLNPLYLEKFKKNKAEIDSLGFKSFNQFSEMIREINFSQFEEKVKGYLRSTDEIYFSLLNDILRTNKIQPDNFHSYDIPKIRRGEKFDKFFKKDSLLVVWKRTLENMGFKIDTLKNLTLNMEDIPTKNPRAACFPVDIPNDIRMSIKPTGGINDYGNLLHETGHSLHFALTKEKDFEYQYLYHYTATETYAFLFQNILDEPEWLKKNLHIKGQDLKNLIKFRAFCKLYITRRYCAKFLYEVYLADSLEVAPKRYSTLMSDILGFKPTVYDEAFFMEDVDDFFYVVDYLRAWFIEAMFKTKLREYFGKGWFDTPQLSETLREYFEVGQRLTVEKLLKKMDFDDYDPMFLKNEINSMVQYSKKKTEN